MKSQKLLLAMYTVTVVGVFGFFFAGRPSVKQEVLNQYEIENTVYYIYQNTINLYDAPFRISIDTVAVERRQPELKRQNY